MRHRGGFLVVVAIASGLVGLTQAGPVGERHLITSDVTASIRDAEHRAEVRVTAWYPAKAASQVKHIDIGPANNPLFRVGAAAEDAAFSDDRARPLILLSHGFGGTARMMGWFGIALAESGYVVVAVDHPGNNGEDKMTTAGAILSWDRAQDLQAALTAVVKDPDLGSHVDPKRVGAAGFSAGGFTALLAAGAAFHLQQLVDFCRQHPKDGVCTPQKEFSLSFEEAQRALTSPALASEAAHASDDHAIAGIRAVFVMAPAIVQSLSRESLENLNIPVSIILGDADRVAPPDTNGIFAARIIPHADLEVLPHVGHYDFLSTCTAAGVATVPVCSVAVPQEQTHQAAVRMALRLFNRVLAAD